MTIDPPKYKIKQQALSDFSATITAKPNLTKEEIFQKFPEFNNDESLLQSAMDYHATSKSGKYKDLTELNSKFPEFEFETEDVKKKDSGVPYSIAAPEQNNLSFTGQVDLSNSQQPENLMANGLTEEQDKQRALQELNPEQQPPNKMEAIQTALESVSPGTASLFDLGRKAIAVVKDQIPASYYGQKAIEKKTDYLDELRRTDPTNYEVQNEFASDETRKKYAERQAIKLLGKEKYEKNKADYAKSSIEEKQALLDEVKTQRQEEADFTKGIPQTWGEAKEKGKIASYISGAIGNGLGQMPSSLATLGGSSYFMEKTDAYEQAVDAIAKENGITPEEVVAKNLDEPAKEVAHTIGLINGGIDLASTIFTVGKTFGAGIKSIVKKNAQEQILKNLPEKVVKESLLKQGVKAAAAPLVEYGTEFTQGFNTQVAALTAAGKDMSDINYEDISKGGDIDYESAHEEGLQGMIASGGIVAGGKAISKINEKQKPNEKPIEPTTSPEPTTKVGGVTPVVESPKSGGAVPEVAKKEVVSREVKPSTEKVKGQEKVDKALENLSKKIKPQEDGTIRERIAETLPVGEAPRGSKEVVEGVSKPKLEETPTTQEEKQVGNTSKEELIDGQKPKTIKQLETENKRTLPKVPVNKVFSNDTAQPPREQRLKADEYIEKGTISELPKEDIDVKNIVPTQKNLTIPNLEKTQDVKESKEDIVLLKHEGKYYVLDGHHRIANDILKGEQTINANVYDATENIEVPDTGSKVPDTESKEKASPEKVIPIKDRDRESYKKYNAVFGDVGIQLIDHAIERSEFPVDVDELLTRARAIQKNDKRESEKIPVEIVAEALQYQSGDPNFNDLRDVVNKGGFENNQVGIERMLDVGVQVPNDILDQALTQEQRDKIIEVHNLNKKSKELTDKTYKELEKMGFVEMGFNQQKLTEKGQLTLDAIQGKQRSKTNRLGAGWDRYPVPLFDKTKWISGQKLSKKEEGKAKVAKGLEGLVSKIGATKNLNPLDDTSVWEDVTNIIDGLADMGIAKTEEVIDYLKKEFKKLGIKEEDVEAKREAIGQYVSGKEPSTPEPSAIETEEQDSKKKKLLNRAFEGTDDTEVADAIEKHGLTYEPETWVHAKERAQAFVAEVGYDNALDAVRKNQIEDGAAAFVWSEIIDAVGTQLSETSNTEDKARLIKLEAELIDEFDRKARSGGRFISALQDVYANSDFGYKLEVQVSKYKERNNGVISPEVEAKFQQLDKELTEAKAKRIEAEERAKKAEDELALQNIKDSIAREKKQNTRSAQKIREAKSERAKLKSEFLSKFNPAKSGGRLNATIPGAIFIEYGIKIANTYIKEGTARLEVVFAKTKEFFDKELGYTMSDQEAADLRDKIKGRIQEIDEKEGKLKIPHSLIREYVEAGAKDVNELVSKIKEDIKETHPNVTDREIRDAITGYGKTTNPSQDEVETEIRRMIRIGRLISKLEDVAQKKRPLRSGRQRDSLDAEERALNKQLISELKGLPIDAETEANQIKTSLDAVKARIKNQIEELNLAIETGKSVARARGISYDEEAKQLETERDQIKEVYDAIFYKRDDDATKIENILAATDRAIEATIKKIETNDLEAKKRGQINNPDVKAAKERLSRLRDRLEQLKEEAGIPQKRRLENTKARIAKQIADLKERLETKNFAKKAKPTPIIRDSELLKLDAEIARIKEEYAKEQYKIELANRTTSQKWIDGLIEAWGLTRVFKATSEMSFIMIQGWVYTVNAVRNPKSAIEGLSLAFSHFASQKRADDFMNHLRAQEYYPEMKSVKLAIAESDVKLTAREEGFISAWGNHLWNFVGYVVGAPLAIWKPAYKAFTTKWKAVNPLSAIERANHAYMNTLRVNKYLQGREMLRVQGKNFNEHPQEYKNLADVINTFTGRASLGVFDRVAKPLAVVFFSPRNWASVIKTATPLAFYHFGSMGSKQPGETTTGLLLKGKVKPSVAQKLALMDYMTAIGVTTATVMLIDAFGDDDEDKEGVSVETDPRSSDFMKIRIGDTRVDPWGGRIQMLVLQARMLPTLLGGGYTKNTSGQLKRLGEGFTSTRGELLGSTVKNKLSPSAAIVWDLFNAKVRHYHGEEILTNKFGGPLLVEDPENNFSPIFWETVGELYDEHPATVASYLTFLAFVGFGVSTYSKEDQRKDKNELMERKRKEIDAEK